MDSFTKILLKLDKNNKQFTGIPTHVSACASDPGKSAQRHPALGTMQGNPAMISSSQTSARYSAHTNIIYPR
jgi:hypothetical protein